MNTDVSEGPTDFIFRVKGDIGEAGSSKIISKVSWHQYLLVLEVTEKYFVQKRRKIFNNTVCLLFTTLTTIVKVLLYFNS
jgi:hypothetical protein